MNSKKSKVAGLVILILVIVSVIVYSVINDSKPKEINATGLIGSEKLGLFEDQEFKDTVLKKYGLTYDVRKSGSYDQVKLGTEELANYDFLFPSNDLALQVFKDRGNKSERSDITFNTPIVLYTRKPIADALIKANVVSVKDNVYNVDMKKMAELIINETSWEELGVNELYGNVLIDTTDPNKSNSGNIFLGLLANSLNDGKVVDENSVNEITPKVKEVYNRLGYMQGNSGDLFNQFLRQGMGSYPIIAGYENQILEFSKENKDVFEQVKDEIVIMYPTPTVWSSHVFISLNEKGNTGLDGLLDQDVQNIAWKNHGFRTGVSGTTDVTEFNVNGLKKDVTNIIPMPNIETMDKMLSAID